MLINKTEAIRRFCIKYDNLKSFAIPMMPWVLDKDAADAAWGLFVLDLVERGDISASNAARWEDPSFPIRVPKEGGKFYAFTE